MSEGLDTVIGGGAIDEARADAVFKQGLDCETAGDRLGAIVAYREAVSHCGKPEHLSVSPICSIWSARRRRRRRSTRPLGRPVRRSSRRWSTSR
jgi:hypothetical protein